MADAADPTALAQSTAEPREEEPEPKVPWHFWLLLVSVVVYLGWRAIEGVQWLLG